MTGTPVRHALNNTPIGTSISTRLATNLAPKPAGKAPQHANPPKNQYFRSFSTHRDRLFLLSGVFFALLSVILPLRASPIAFSRKALACVVSIGSILQITACLSRATWEIRVYTNWEESLRGAECVIRSVAEAMTETAHESIVIRVKRGLANPAGAGRLT